ncbi:phenoloxidase-activating factor 3-like [Homarus americanus]|uniref:phenoloxidase-activating factor 3-like n=1 Tax=Homarus americanus TaxID=6706 RepID=UPI001C48FDBE|nr:phenoloxidase-activating factor 3-like [Homarus americanus]
MTPVVMVVWLLVVVGCCSTTLAQTDVSLCFDKSPLCKTQAEQGRCTTLEKEMEERCPVSCGKCFRRPPPPTIAKPNFECGGGSNINNLRQNPIKPENNLGNGPINPGNGPINPGNGPSNPGSSRGGRRSRTAGPQLGSTSESSLHPQVQLSDLSVQDTFCGATPISDRYLLTAAFCVFDPVHPISTVRLGELDFSKDNETNARPRDYQIEQIIVHPDYQPDSPVRSYDIALLKTVEKISFNDVVFPFCVSSERPSVGTTVIGSGFGLVNETHQSPVLQEVEVEVMALAECEKQYQEAGLLPHLKQAYPNLLNGSKVICAGYPGRGACKGDEGGPLYLDDGQGHRYLVGIVSFTGACKKESVMPGIYTNVADHIDFIDSVLYGGN